MSKEVRKLSK